MEQERLLDLIERTGAEGVIFLSGDRHFAEISRRDSPSLYPLYEVTSSGLNRALPAPVPNHNEFQVGPHLLDHNYGSIRIHWADKDEGDQTEISLSIRDRSGTVVSTQVVRLADLVFRGPARR